MLLRAVRPAFGTYRVADRYQAIAHMGIGHTLEMIAPVDLASHVVFKVGSRSVKCIIVLPRLDVAMAAPQTERFDLRLTTILMAMAAAPSPASSVPSLPHDLHRRIAVRGLVPSDNV